MKNIFMSLLLLTGITLSVTAQEKDKVRDKDVPETIKTALKGAFPDASGIDWKMKDGMYKAKFKVNGTNHIAGITASGEVKSKGMEIRKDDLPAAVTTAIQSAHSGWSIDDVYRVDEGGNIKYLVALDGNPDKKVLYSADGKLEKEMAIDD